MPSDSPLPHATLLEQQAFLRRLARSLVSDAHRAEDLAQDATLAALERAPTSATSLRSWLARVIRNRAINLGLADERRRAREQAAPSVEPPRSPDELEEHFQVQRRVMEAVDRLEEPYRTAILLRYYRDLAPTAIAEQLGVPVATVKSRLARALARLRAELDDGDPRGSHAWIAVLAGGLGELHRPITATALAAGGFAMGLKLALSAGAACAVLALGGWWWSRPEAGPTRAPSTSDADASASHAAPATQELARIDPHLEVGRAPVGAADSISPAPSETPSAFTLELEIRGLDEEARGPISLAIHSGSTPLPTWTESRALEPDINLDLGPVFEQVKVRPDQITVLLDHPNYLPTFVGVLVPEELRQLETASGHLTAAADLVRAKAIVTGQVELESSAPDIESRVAIFALKGDRPIPNPIEVVAPDAERRFRVRAGAADRHAVVALDARAQRWNPIHSLPEGSQLLRPDTRVVSLSDGDRHDIGVLTIGEGESIQGVVVAVDSPLPRAGRARALLEDRSLRPWGNLAWIGDRFELQGQAVAWSESGEFRITGIASLPYMLHAIPGRQETERRFWILKHDEQRVVVTPPASGVRLAIDRTAVTIEVRAEGLALPNAALGYELIPPLEAKGQMWVTADENGRAMFELQPGIGLDLKARDVRYGSKELRLSAEDMASSGTFVIDLDGPRVEPATLLLVPRASDPRHLDGVALDLRLFETATASPEDLELARDEKGPSTSSRTDSASVLPDKTWPTTRREGDGVAVSDIRPGKYLVCIYPRAREPGESCLLLGDRIEVELQSGQVLVQDWHARLGGAVRLSFNGSGAATRAEILGGDGEPLDLDFRWTETGASVETYGGSTPRLAGVTWVQPALVAGAYMLRIRMADKSYRTIPFQIEAGRVTDVVVDLSTL